MKAATLLIISVICLCAFGQGLVLDVNLSNEAGGGGGGGSHGEMILRVNADTNDVTMNVGLAAFYQSGEGSDGEGWFGADGGQPYMFQATFFLTNTLAAANTITNATIQLYGMNTFSWVDGTDDLEDIFATYSHNARPPDNYGERPTRYGGSFAYTTNAVVTWPNITWATSSYNTSTNIASIINNLLTTFGDLTNTSGIGLWLSRQSGGPSGTDQISAEMREWGSGDNVAILTIQW